MWAPTVQVTGYHNITDRENGFPYFCLSIDLVFCQNNIQQLTYQKPGVVLHVRNMTAPSGTRYQPAQKQKGQRCPSRWLEHIPSHASKYCQWVISSYKVLCSSVSREEPFRCGVLGHKGHIKTAEGDLAWEQQHLGGKRRYDDLIKYDVKRNQHSVPLHCRWIRQDGRK